MAPGGPDIAIPVDLDWDEIEAKYWASMKGPRDQAGRQLEQEFDAARKPLEEHVHSQTMMVLSLEEEEREILERLNEVRRLKKDATDDIKRTTTELKAIHLEHRERRRNFEDGMVTWETEKKEYFRQCREKQNETKTVRPAAPVEDGSAAADLNRGGPVQLPDVETLSDNGPREVVMTEDQVPTVPKSNGQEAQVTQDAQDEDVDMSEANAGEEKQSESTPGVADQSRTAVTEEIATAQQATSQQASAPTVANASDEASTSAATSASLPQVAQPPPVTNGHKEATSGDEQPAEQSSAENAVADAAPAKQPEPPAQPDANKEATIETNVQAQKKDIRQSSDDNATAATKAPQQSPQLTAAESDAAPATLGDKDTEQPAPSASAAGDDDVAMKDVTVAIREKDAEESVDEAQVAEASRELSATTDADVSMADGPADPVSSESVPAEEPAGNSAVPPPTADTLSVVTGKKAVDDDAIESNQATSPASSLSSLTSNFDDLDEPDSSTLRQDTVEVIDQNGLVVGELRPLGRENRSISLITKMPIRRRVQIRTGRNFTTADLEKVHQPNDQKGAKWVSMYIQAVGDIQQHPCQACAKKNGVYQECIMVDNETFSKCGNCEWNRHACLGAGQPGSNSNSRPSSRQSIARQSLSGKVGNRPTTPGGSFTPINQSFASKDGDSISVDGDATTPTGIKNSVIAKKPGRTSLPGARKMASAPGSPTTPMVGTPAVNMAEHDDEEELPPITPDILCLRDDGTVFTDPPLMRGVPLEKIGSDHPYWDPNWEADIASIITQEHQKWMEKYKDMESQGVNDHRKYEAKRQVNRGNTILKWLASGELHPYQLVAKKWMNTKKLIKYNTLYRLAQMLDNELPLYKLNMKASDWMRHRLNELFLEDGDEFNLAAHVAGFYHDPKVQQARDKAGYTSVGRPTKASTKKVAGESAVTPKASVQRPLKRKEPPAAGENTPTAALQQQQQQQQVRTSPRKIVVVGAGASSSSSSAAASGGVTNQAPTAAGGSTSSDKAHFPPQPLAPDDSDSDDDDKEIKVQQSPAPPRSAIKKKIRLTVNSGSPMAVSATSHDLISDGYTSIDSCSEDKLHDIDWRINQIKTPEVSTHPSVTQYWHFVGPQAGMLEHQVLKQLRPAKWAVFRQPYDFHLRYREVTEIVYATQSLRVIIRFKRGKNQAEGEGRGDMLAEFKRDRTKRRFLKFMASKGVKLLRSSRDYVENAWNDMIPEFNMPGNDSD